MSVAESISYNGFRNKNERRLHNVSSSSRVTCPWQDRAYSTSWYQLKRSCAHFHTELRWTLYCWRSRAHLYEARFILADLAGIASLILW